MKHLLLRPILAMLAAAVLFTVYTWDVNRSERAILRGLQQQQVLFQTPDTVTEIVFENEHGRMRIERPGGAGGSWRIVEPVNAPADAGVLDSYLENLRGARRQASFPPEGDDLGRYGLDEPSRSVSIRLTGEDGAEAIRSVLFGDQPSQHGPVYAKLDGEEQIFTVSEWFYRNSNKQLSDVRDRSILPGLFEQATALRISSRNTTFRVERPDASSENWRLVREGHPAVPVDRVLLGRVMENLEAGRFLESGSEEDFEAGGHGLDDPAVRLHADGDLVFTIGNRVEDREQFYARTGEDTVGIVPGSLIVDLLRPAAEWGTKRFVWFARGQIQSIETTSGPSSMQLLRDDDGEWYFAASPGVPVHPRRLEEFLNRVTTLSANQLVRADLPREEWRGHGILGDGFRLLATGPDGQVHGLRFGHTDSGEGYTYMLREQDNSLWRVDFRAGGQIFKFRRDLEDRRIVKDLTDRTARFDIVVGPEVMRLERTQAAWRVEVPGERPTLLRPTAVLNFLESFGAMESDGEMVGPGQQDPQATFRFYDSAGAEEPFAELGLLTRTANAALFLMEDRVLEVPAELFEPVDDEMVRLILAAKAQAEQERTP